MYKDGTVAIKFIRREGDTRLSEEEYSEFIREGKLMLELEQNVNVIRVLAICVSETNPAIIMEHAPKGTLKTYLVNSQCNLHLDLVFKLVIGIASGGWWLVGSGSWIVFIKIVTQTTHRYSHHIFQNHHSSAICYPLSHRHIVLHSTSLVRMSYLFLHDQADQNYHPRHQQY
eukprot:TRINITY_DN2705_c0_g2_i18.p1 TRINITY_DN2705_c0_g2~~TRINITY_DN2705_c0_g2_i18.p1  ORF type:complete len:172 (-),score=29.32 TRINITY_DN2705_c0_g2_i18:837-1352(-)